VQSLDDAQVGRKIKDHAEKIKLKTEIPKQVQTKEKIVVLGSGWGAHAFLKTVDSTKYDVTVISPRNYFTFTPMLAASAVGTVEFRSICEPIRNANELTSYVEASATEIDPERKVVSCQSIQCQGTACDFYDFDVPYDKLLVAVGATTNTFGIKGVREHCLFLKQVEDAGNLRRALAYCFERASIPSLSEEEIRAALSFVIVGAGPTGVEYTSELRDWLETEGRKYFPKLLKYAKITLIEAGSAVLAVFDEILQKDALKRLTG
jgi:NADH dehydrogenase FAD-containing subunit